MRSRLGAALQVIGLVLMPLAFVQGFRDELSFGEEVVVAFVGFLLIVIGRGLRGGASAK
jgi:hypothetical protein